MSKGKLPTVREYMATDVHVFSPEMNILDAVDLILENDITGAPVLEAGELVGILSEKDCLALLTEGADNDLPVGTVGDYMVREVTTIPPDMDIYYCAGLFLKNVFRRMPVIAGGRLVGQISRRDVLRAVQTNFRLGAADGSIEIVLPQE